MRRVYLLGTAFGILQHQRGRMVLHASAVAVGDKAALFAGPQGGRQVDAGRPQPERLSARQRRRLRHRLQLRPARGAAGRADAEAVGRHRQRHLEMGEQQEPSIRRRLTEVLCRAQSTAVDRDLAVAAVYVLRVAGPRQQAGVERLGPAGTPPCSCAATPIGRASSPSSASRRLSRLVVGLAPAGRRVQP